MLAFGPIPSRRLGFSLGINNIPPKVCSYACVYCQVGRTTRLETTRGTFYAPAEIFEAVSRKVEQVRQSGASIDYLSFVPDGEPTLDENLGQAIELLRPLGYKIAVITNSSLIWLPEVQADLQEADWVSLKMDAVHANIWHKINRPHGYVSLAKILSGAHNFARIYRGTLVTETMLVRNVNDSDRSLEAVAEFVDSLSPARAYISIPTRPPAESWVEVPDEAAVHRAYQIFEPHLDQVELLISYEGNEFHASSAVEQDLLDILAVHPMREETVETFLNRAGAGKAVIQRLIATGAASRVFYRGAWFYVRRFSGSKPAKHPCSR